MKIYEVQISYEKDEWVDSYWDNAKDAIHEAKRVMNDISYPVFNSVIVFERTLNIEGIGKNLWRDDFDKIIYKREFYQEEGQKND